MSDLRHKLSLIKDKVKQKFLGPEQIVKNTLPSVQASNAADGSQTSATTQRAIDVYLMSKQGDGQMGGIGWWQTANGYTAIALHDMWSSSRQNLPILIQALKQCEGEKPNFINEFNDDSLWWALCSFHVYTLTEDRWFLDRAQTVWDHVAGSVCRPGQAQFQGHDMAGACLWTTKPGEEQINSITTGLFAELSVRLALLDPSQVAHTREQYVEATRNALGWIFQYRFRSEDAVVLDHILLQKQEAVDWTFTYTTGVAIGASALLYKVSGDQDFLAKACNMARMGMKRESWVEADGVLTERGAYGNDNHSAVQNSDAVGFKSVLIRQLATLVQVIDHLSAANDDATATADLIKSFLQVNFASQQERNTNGEGQYGPWWDGPFDTPTSHSQMAVLDVMAAAVLV